VSSGPYVAFYQTAAPLLAVLLLTGAFGESRAIREREADLDWSRRDVAGLVLLVVVVVVVAIGEYVALSVLAHPPGTGGDQRIVAICLIVSLASVAVLAVLPVADSVARSARRTESSTGLVWLGRVPIVLGAAGAVAAAALIAWPGFVGTPGLASPTIGGLDHRDPTEADCAGSGIDISTETLTVDGREVGRLILRGSSECATRWARVDADSDLPVEVEVVRPRDGAVARFSTTEHPDQPNPVTTMLAARGCVFARARVGGARAQTSCR